MQWKGKFFICGSCGNQEIQNKEQLLEQETNLLQQLTDIKTAKNEIKYSICFLLGTLAALLVTFIGALNDINFLIIIGVIAYCVLSIIGSFIGDGFDKFFPDKSAAQTDGCAGCLVFVLYAPFMVLHMLIGWFFLVKYLKNVLGIKADLIRQCGLRSAANIDQLIDQQQWLVDRLNEICKN